MSNYDVVIIGAGPAGYVTAIRLAQFGIKVAVIESEHLGGICLNWGCIPTKALLHAADIYSEMKLNGARLGILCSDLKCDLPTMINNSRAAASKLSHGIQHLLKKNNVHIIWGRGRLINKNTVSVTNNDEPNKYREISGKYIVLATGAHPRSVSNIVVDHKYIWDYKDALQQHDIPKHLLIIGGGVIGIEFASFYHAIGSNVTIIEKVDRILAQEDEEISAFVHQELVKRGVKIYVNADIKKVEIKTNETDDEGNSVQVHVFISHNENRDMIISGSNALLSIGVVPNTDNLGLENVGVNILKNKHISIDGSMRTNIDNIYAIGDITTYPLVAHKAIHQGMLCAESIACCINAHNRHLPKFASDREVIGAYGVEDRSVHVVHEDLSTGATPQFSAEVEFLKKSNKANCNIRHINTMNIPMCTYSNPQIASIGYTEAKAIELGYNVRVGRFPLAGNGKAVAMGDTTGFVKVIVDKTTGELLGVHMVGNGVTELIHSIAIAKELECIDIDIIRTIFPHPTLSEVIPEAVMDAIGIATHK